MHLHWKLLTSMRYLSMYDTRDILLSIIQDIADIKKC